MLKSVAVLSLHTSPMAQPGHGDSGGMNVYVRELTAGLAHTGIDCTVYVRRWADDLPEEVRVEPGVRVVHVDAGPSELPKEALPGVVDAFTDGVLAHLSGGPAPDVVHANYWLSGVVGHRLKHELCVPLVATFHTLAHVKSLTGDPEPAQRAVAEAEIVACADVLTASCQPEAGQLERLYDADPARIAEVPPGVDHALFSPGDASAAREAIGVPDRPLVLFVGRIQPLKGASVAVEAFAALDRRDAQLVIVGGPSGPEGRAEMARIRRIVERHRLDDRVRLVPPQPHHLLGGFYRAADVVLVPSRSESFGLVALEAAACGTPVVAAGVGGLRTIVDHTRTGFVVDGRDPAAFAAYADEILGDGLLAAQMAHAAASQARDYTWRGTAERLCDAAKAAVGRVLVRCG